MFSKTILALVAVVLQCHLSFCAPPINIPSQGIPSSGAVSRNDENQPGSISFTNGALSGNGLSQKYGGYDPQQSQLNGGYNSPYAIQRPVYFVPPQYNQPSYQLPMNYYNGYANPNNLYFGDMYRPQSGIVPGVGYGSNSMGPVPNQYPHYPQFGQPSSHSSQQQPQQQQYPSQSGSLSPFARSMSQRRSDDLEKKSP